MFILHVLLIILIFAYVIDMQWRHKYVTKS